MIEEDTFQKMVLVGLILVLVPLFFVYQSSENIRNTMSTGDSCAQVVDIIYEQCREESEIKMETLEGRTTTLKYENGVCVIK